MANDRGQEDISPERRQDHGRGREGARCVFSITLLRKMQIDISPHFYAYLINRDFRVFWLISVSVPAGHLSVAEENQKAISEEHRNKDRK